MWITTWNVNGIRARKERVLKWIDAYYPTVLCLQETRCPDNQFPYNELRKFYPYIEHCGQKGSNGVALLSKHKIKEVHHDFIGNYNLDDSCRSLFGTINGIRIGSLYIPQGQNLESPKFKHKKYFLGKLYEYLEVHSNDYDAHIIVGDYNIAPTEKDVWSTKYWHDGIVSCTPHEREALAKLQNDFGLVDSIRSLTEEQVFTWWGYINFSMKYGVRIDHILHSNNLTAKKFHIDKEERTNTKGASDHAPVSVLIK